MRDADTSVEKVLDGLRGSRPAAGLEGRVLRAVRERRHERRGWLVLWSKQGYAAFAGLVIVAGLVLCFVRKEPARFDPGPLVRVPALAGPVAPRGAVLSRGPSVPARELAATVRRVPRGAAARRSSREVSYPAPPLPLTEQEELLLRVAHHRTAEAVASLTPEVQVAQAAREKDEFTKFFDGQNGGTHQ